MEEERVFDAEKVERRCRACEDKSDSEWECMSSVGFLAPSEKLLDVIRRDEAALNRLQTTRAAIGKQLRELLAALQEQKGDEGRILFRGREWSWKRAWFVSPQYSPFREVGKRHEQGWSEEWKLQCGGGEIKLLLTRGTVDMIEDFGFFEGGLDGSNPYRIDPDTAVCAVTGGAITRQVREFAELRAAFKKAARQKARDELIAVMQPRLNEPGAREYLEHQLQKLK
jgi:hypothetical protein